MQDRGMTVGRFAARAGVNVETVRYYQRRGLLARPARAGGGVRRYGEDSLQRIRFIKRAQHLGFTLDEVRALLLLNDGTGCVQARAIGERKLAEVEAKLMDLQAMSRTLATLIERCRARRGRVVCPLIDALAQPTASHAE